jgi:hypothetical protein
MAQNALVNLIIKAKDEASRVLRGVVAALKGQEQAQSQVAQSSQAAEQAESQLTQAIAAEAEATEHAAAESTRAAESQAQQAQSAQELLAKTEGLVAADQKVATAETSKADAAGTASVAIEGEVRHVADLEVASDRSAAASRRLAEGMTAAGRAAATGGLVTAATNVQAVAQAAQVAVPPLDRLALNMSAAGRAAARGELLQGADAIGQLANVSTIASAPIGRIAVGMSEAGQAAQKGGLLGLTAGQQIVAGMSEAGKAAALAGQQVGAVPGGLAGIAGAATRALAPLLAFATVARIFQGIRRSTDDLNASLRQLEGTANLVGIPLEFLQGIAARGRREFGLSAAEANRFAAELTTLASKAGQLRLAQEGLADFLNLAAAAGLGPTEALEALRGAAEDNFRTFGKIVNQKPDEILKLIADRAGVAADELTEAQKATGLFALASDAAAKNGTAHAKAQSELSAILRNLGDDLGDVAGKFGLALTPLVKLFSTLLKLTLIPALEGAANALLSLTIIGGSAFESLKEGAVGAFATIKRAARFDFSGAETEAKASTDRIRSIWKKAADDLAVLAKAPGTAAAGDQSARNTAIRDEPFQPGPRAQTATERLQEIVKEVELIQKRVSLGKQTTEDVRRLAAFEKDIQVQLAAQNLTTERRQALEAALLKVAETRQVIGEKSKRTAEEAADEARRQSDAELALIRDRVEQGQQTEDDVKTLDRLHDELTKELERQNLKYTEQLELLGKLRAVDEARALLASRLPDPNAPDRNAAFRDQTLQQGGAERSFDQLEEGRTADILRNPNLAGDSPLTEHRREEADRKREQTLEDMAHFAQDLRNAVAGPLADFFEQGIEGFESLGDAANKFAQSVLKALARIAAQKIALAIVGAFTGGAGGAAAAAGGAKDGAFVMGGRLVAPRRFADGGMADDPPHKRRYAHAMSYAPQKYAVGGMVRGPGGPRDDLVPALLSNGEAVLNARAVNAIGGRPAIDYLNSLVSPLTRFAEGGMVSVAHVGDARDVTASVEGAIEVGLAEGLVAREIKKRSGRDALFTVMGEEKRRVDALLERRVGR